ncbi:hypothetical protein D3C73_985840 [compost metagenome]
MESRSGVFRTVAYTINPITAATIKARPIRAYASSGWARNAVRVAPYTTGFRIGPERMKTIATYNGMPLCIKRRTSGIIPHSHTGKRMPSRQPNRMAGNGRRGIQREIISSGTNTRSSEESNAPRSTNGKASSRMPMKPVLKASVKALFSTCGWPGSQRVPTVIRNAAGISSGSVLSGEKRVKAGRTRRTSGRSAASHPDGVR